MAMPPDVPMEEFLDLVATKFGMGVSDLKMKFADEDGTKVSLLDESDYELALATARENANGKSEGKLTIWVE
jgi:neutrophil cytosolic factor 2